MEVGSGYTTFPVTVAVPVAPQSALTGSVDTLLPQGSQSVAPIGASASAGQTEQQPTGNGAPSGSVPDSSTAATTVAKFTRDPSTNSLVFMEIDPQTEQVVLQFPDEQALKLKSYLAEIQRRENAFQRATPGTLLAKTT